MSYNRTLRFEPPGLPDTFYYVVPFLFTGKVRSLIKSITIIVLRSGTVGYAPMEAGKVSLNTYSPRTVLQLMLFIKIGVFEVWTLL